MKKNIFIHIALFVSALIGMTACDDWFNITPPSETVFEDYWKDESDVQSVLASCYRGMTEDGFMERMVVWGEARSDNAAAGSNTGDDLTNLLNLTFTSSNSYTSWGDYYKVINYCNTVLEYAPEVQKEDPNFTQGQLNAYLAEATGIRALCYFTLVRVFRDIPLITTPYADDTKPFEVPQTSSDSVCRFLVNDLKTVENEALVGYANNRIYDKGKITQKAIWALLADIYLWMNDYDNCIMYCDKILNDPENQWRLEIAEYYSRILFNEGNSDESIFELQFQSVDSRENKVAKIYSTGGEYTLSAFNFSKISPKLFEAASDLREADSYCTRDDGTFYPIVKYITYLSPTVTNRQDVPLQSYSTSKSYYTNWIFYRLSDVYLMKAEALVEKGSSYFQEAFDLVLKTYERANKQQATLDFDKYKTSQLDMRNLVFDERQREFLFEGKRYFDILRRINREGSPTYVVSNYLMKKYVAIDPATAKSRLNDIDALYMPIHRDELKKNTALKQNPFYATSSDTQQN